MGAVVGLIFAVLFFFVILPYLIRMEGDLKVSFSFCSKKKKQDEEPKEQTVDIESDIIDEKEESLPIIEKDDFVDESDEVKRIFRPLQLLAACFGALTHGSNDVGNCIGPLVTVWYVYQNPLNYSTEGHVYAILLWGGVGISLG